MNETSRPHFTGGDKNLDLSHIVNPNVKYQAIKYTRDENMREKIITNINAKTDMKLRSLDFKSHFSSKYCYFTQNIL